MNGDIYPFLSELEKKVFSWLTRNEVPFETQVPMFGGAGEVGSATVDFILAERNLALRTMGSYWHSTTNRHLLQQSNLLRPYRDYNP